MPGPTSSPCTLISYRIVSWWWRRVWMWSAWSTGATSGRTCWRFIRLVSCAPQCGWWPCGGSICTIAETCMGSSAWVPSGSNVCVSRPVHRLADHLALGCCAGRPSSPNQRLIAVVGWLCDCGACKALTPGWAWCMVLLAFARRDAGNVIINEIANLLHQCNAINATTQWCTSTTMQWCMGATTNLLRPCGLRCDWLLWCCVLLSCCLPFCALHIARGLLVEFG